mgnify:CR=1 FL=1
MEAKWLFDVDIDRIQILVQPQSVIHSMVEFDDGAVIAQMGTPDMRLPIQYALFYPKRMYLCKPSPVLSLKRLEDSRMFTIHRQNRDAFLGGERHNNMARCYKCFLIGKCNILSFANRRNCRLNPNHSHNRCNQNLRLFHLSNLE